MTPLATFLTTAQALAVKPLHFWTPAEQTRTLRETATTVARLKKTLEKKQLTTTAAYQTLGALEASLSETAINEIVFIQNLANLVEVYRHAPADKKLAAFLVQLDGAVMKAKKRILEYHIALEDAREKSKGMSATDQKKHDQKIIKEIGLFYILEYTLQVLTEFTRLTKPDKEKLLHEGLATKAGNLPAYLPLEDTFRKELCLKLFDDNLRDRLLPAFYTFETTLYTNDVTLIGSALRTFNISLLKAFKEKGLIRFKAMIYKPFGADVPVDELIKKIEQIKF